MEIVLYNTNIKFDSPGDAEGIELSPDEGDGVMLSIFLVQDGDAMSDSPNILLWLDPEELLAAVTAVVRLSRRSTMRQIAGDET